MKPKYRIVVYIVIIALIGLGLFINHSNNKKMKEIEIVKKPIINEEVPTKKIPTIDFNALRKKYNKDIVGAIRILDEDFEEVIFQTKDNKYYLKHNYKGKYDINGEIFLDYRVNIDNSKIKLIYGHSAPNYKLPSNTLEKYYDEEYYKTHKYLELETDKDIYKYEIVSVYVETSDWYYMTTSFATNEGYQKHLDKLKSKSMYKIDTELTVDDEILIYQTCSNKKEYAKYPKKYLLVIAKKIKN